MAVGPGIHGREGNLIPVSVKEGDTVLLPEYGGTQVNLGDKEYALFLLPTIAVLIFKCHIYVWDDNHPSFMLCFSLALQMVVNFFFLSIFKCIITIS